ncbi:MAG: hypothetical protein JXR83_02885 [Deltaproteobacteria bacterium]|nr:hypothetical protein [Deltaproteobacteria bacterium]
MVTRSLSDSVLRYTGLPHAEPGRLEPVPASALRPVVEQLAELEELAPELAPEVQRLLNTRRGSSGTAAASLERRYGPGAAAYAERVELALVRVEAALLAVQQGVSQGLLVRLLGSSPAHSKRLAQQIQELAEALRDPAATPERCKRAKLEARLLLRAAMLPAGSLRGEDAERLLDEQFHLTSGAPAPAAERGGRRERTEVDTVVERSSPLNRLRRGGRTRAPSFAPVRYAPGSPAAIGLFRQAARLAGLPKKWAISSGLHAILESESDGWVGKPNGTYGKRSRNQGRWGEVVQELREGDVRARSTASGLGQLSLSSVEALYPSGRAGIGVPVEEAIGMLRYIEARYGDPERAWDLYGVLCEGY